MTNKTRYWGFSLTGSALIAGALFLIVSQSAPAPVSAPGAGLTLPPRPDLAVATGAARYEVLGDGPAIRIDYSIVGEEAGRDDVPLPWFKSTGATFMSMTAQRGEGEGTITCRITGDGRVIQEDTDTGPFAACRVAELMGAEAPEVNPSEENHP